MFQTALCTGSEKLHWFFRELLEKRGFCWARKVKNRPNRSKNDQKGPGTRKNRPLFSVGFGFGLKNRIVTHRPHPSVKHEPRALPVSPAGRSLIGGIHLIVLNYRPSPSWAHSSSPSTTSACPTPSTGTSALTHGHPPPYPSSRSHAIRKHINRLLAHP